MGDGFGGIVGGVGKGGNADGVVVGNMAFLGCLAAWGVTECIRYGFFALTLSGFKVPSWWMWLRFVIIYVFLFICLAGIVLFAN